MTAVQACFSTIYRENELYSSTEREARRKKERIVVIILCGLTCTAHTHTHTHTHTYAPGRDVPSYACHLGQVGSLSREEPTVHHHVLRSETEGKSAPIYSPKV